MSGGRHGFPRSGMRGVIKGPTRLLAGIAVASILVGCSGSDMDDLRAYVEQVKSRRHGKIEPLPEVKPYETFTYQAQELRDPFTPGTFNRPAPAAAGTKGGIKPDFNRPREALEEYPLDTLRMVGILEQGGQVWALIKTSDGTIHRVRRGNYLGQNHGRITRIDENKVEIVEIIPDGLGGWMKREASLTLSE